MNEITNCNMTPMGLRPREGALFDTALLATTTAWPDSFVLFQTDRNTVGANLCNLELKGQLGSGESFVVNSIEIETTGMTVADINTLNKFFVFDLEIGGRKEVKDQPISLYPQRGGTFGVEGANGATTNGPTGFHATVPLKRPISIPPQTNIVLTLKKGKGSAVPAALGAAPNSSAAVFVRFLLAGDDYTRN
jgi:hypothetical protein